METFRSWEIIPDEYWKRSREAQEFLQNINVENYRVDISDFIRGEMKKVRSLDVGCGTRWMGSAANIDRERPPTVPDNFQIMDAHNLDFRENTFEAVSLVGVIEHVENPPQVLREIHRVLTEDGVLYLTTVNPYHISHFLRCLRNKRFVIQCDHLYFWAWEMLAWMLHNVGFRDFEVCFWGDSDRVLSEGKWIKLFRSYHLANLLYRLGFRNPMLHLGMYIKCRK